MAHWAYPGVKCVCVDATPVRGKYWVDEAPVVGEVYTVRGRFTDEDGDDVLLLNEISNGPDGDGREMGYYSWRFRPLITKSQEDDVALFAPILNTREREST